MLNNMKFSMLVNMHVSEHVMLFLDEPTLKLIKSFLYESLYGFYPHQIEYPLEIPKHNQ